MQNYIIQNLILPIFFILMSFMAHSQDSSSCSVELRETMEKSFSYLLNRNGTYEELNEFADYSLLIEYYEKINLSMEMDSIGYKTFYDMTKEEIFYKSPQLRNFKIKEYTACKIEHSAIESGQKVYRVRISAIDKQGDQGNLVMGIISYNGRYLAMYGYDKYLQDD